MDLKENVQGLPREIIVSSAILVIMALFRFLPSGIPQSVPYNGFFSALTANTLTTVTMLSGGFPFNNNMLGVIMLGVVASTFVFRERTYSLHFLTTGTLAFYGFVTLALAVMFPSIASDLEVLGLGVQVIFLGLATTENYKNVLNAEEFPWTAHRTGLAASLWQFVAGFALLSSFQFIASGVFGTEGTAVFAALGILGLTMMYSAVELSFNTAEGFWLSMLFLSGLMLGSVGAGSISGALIPFGFLVVLWMTKEKYGVEDHPFTRLKNRV